MRVLAIDVGSSSVKAVVVENGRVLGEPRREPLPTQYAAERVEVEPRAVVAAIAKAASCLDHREGLDLLALCTMSPSWLAMDAKGRPLTKIITHQDRRSVEVAKELEKRVGRARHLRIAGNRPFPGGISSTTAAWFAKHEPHLLKRADLVGHLSTYLLRRWTGARVTDPSNASFMGVYETTTLRDWSDLLMDAAGLRRSQLPEILDAATLAGTLKPLAARELGLPEGLPVLPGIMDTSAAVLLHGAKSRMLFNVSGSTDVLAICVDTPRPHAKLLTRALGIGRKWMAVSTLASAGTTLSWLHQTLFSELPEREFQELVARTVAALSSVKFEPYLAGDRLRIDQLTAAFSGLTLSTTREEMLAAALDALSRQSADRIPLLESVYGRPGREVMVSGGVGATLSGVIHRDWPGQWTFHCEEEATVRGLYALAETVRGRR